MHPAGRREGWTYEAVRAELGYANSGTVWRIVNSALEVRTVEAVDDLRTLQTQRLEALLSSAWDKASAGDVEAILACLRAMQAEAKLLGLTAEARPCKQPQTVVLMDNDCRLRGCPQHA